MCRYNGVNALLAERGLPLCEEAARACKACKAPGLPNDGVSWVHLDAADSPEAVYMGRTAPDWTPGGGGSARHGRADDEKREAALDLLRRFAALPFRSAGVICGMLAGKTLAQMAVETRLSVALLHLWWKMACEVDPVWKSIENGMMGKGIGAKPGKKAKTYDEEAKSSAFVQTEMEI